MKFRTLLLAVLLPAFAVSAYSQDIADPTLPDTSDYPYWVEMMQDPSVNFYKVQRAFNQYWEGREITKGSGFKPFKRWEYRMIQSRIYPDGERIPSGYKRDQYFEFLENNPPTRDDMSEWTSLGPSVIPTSDRGYKGLGRLNAIAFHPTDPDIIYVGSPSGGFWKTETGGNDWATTTDDQPTLGVSAILVDYVDPDMIYIGTGDRDAGDADGLGVFRSTDGGDTWEEWNNGMGNLTVGMLIQHPDNNQLILAATSGGIYKTLDAGNNWTLIQTGNFKDIVFKPGDPNTVYATASGNFFKSNDLGDSFTMILQGLPGAARGVIAVTPAAPDYVYFLLTNSDSYKGLYRSTNSGVSFTERSTTPNIMSWGCNGGSGGQAWYDLDIAVDPFDADVIYAGGVNCFKSINGGQTWSISSHWWGDCGVPAVHADLHVLEYNPINWTLYAGNDGGIYYTTDQGTSWILISNGLVISQVYKIGQSATMRDKVLNGYQDNGTSTYMGDYWEFTRGGDGMECAVDHQNPAYSYATVYYGNIDRYLNNSYDADVASNGNFGLDETGAWVTPFILDEYDASIMFLGYENVWRCDNVNGPSWQIQWEKISDFTTGSKMRVLEQSPANPNILFAANYGDRLFRTENAYDHDANFVELTSYLPANAGINDIECHPEDENVLYISHNFKVWKSEDKGLTWEDISGTLPSVAFTSIAFYERSHDGLYLSSDIGVYYKDAFMDDWMMFSNGLPVDASIQEIEIFYDPDSINNDVIRAGTYGRGMWESGVQYSAPVADFSAEDTLISVGCEIDFTDLSAGIPFEWTWHFEGATPVSSAERNPTAIKYDTAGVYQVKLVVSNTAGMDSVIKSSYITVSDELLPEVGFMADETITCTNGMVQFTDTTKYCPDTWEWSFDPATVSFLEGTTANSQDPVVMFDQPGEYSVTLTSWNGNGSNTVTREEYIMAGGFPIPFTDDFESASLESNGWTIENPDLNYTWAPFYNENLENHSMKMIHFGYFNVGERDRLITPFLNFSGFDEVYLSFRHAYAQRFSLADSLIIYLSDDCGGTWSRIWEGGPDGTGTFATKEPFPYDFTPETADDWCGAGWGSDCIGIDLSAWAGSPDIKLMFESYNDLGNNFYLDDVMVANFTGVDQPAVSDKGISIYPNPNRGTFTVSLSEVHGDIKMDVFDLTGRKVFSDQIVADGAFSKEINLEGDHKGVFLISVTSDRKIFNERVLIK